MTAARLPSAILEYAYFGLVAYSILGQVVISVPYAGAAALAGLALSCLASLTSQRRQVLRAIRLPVACALIFLGIQLWWHHQSLLETSLRQWGTWICGLVAVQCLALRPGFLHRFAIAALGVGLCLMPYLNIRVMTSAIERVGVEQAGLSNPNSLGMWFGFCAVYFVVRGMTSQRVTRRIGAWSIALGCLYVVGMTVSRGPLVGVMLASVVACREVLRRGFIPLVMLLALTWGAAATGVFDRIANAYAERGLEDTGRADVWPEAVARILEWPLVGVGVQSVGGVLRHGAREIAPHNAVLYIALAAGVIPAFVFIAYWVRTALALFRSNDRTSPDRPFYGPLFVFAFLEMMILDTAFMSPWHLVVLCGTSAAAMRHRAMVWQQRVGPRTPGTRVRVPAVTGPSQVWRPAARTLVSRSGLPARGPQVRGPGGRPGVRAAN